MSGGRDSSRFAPLPARSDGPGVGTLVQSRQNQNLSFSGRQRRMSECRGFHLASLSMPESFEPKPRTAKDDCGSVFRESAPASHDGTSLGRTFWTLPAGRRGWRSNSMGASISIRWNKTSSARNSSKVSAGRSFVSGTVKWRTIRTTWPTRSFSKSLPGWEQPTPAPSLFPGRGETGLRVSANEPRQPGSART